jgi:hypothetical protein
MKQILLLLALAAGISSCKKDDTEPAQPQNPPATAGDYTKLAIGNYWVYENVNVDTDGVVTPMTNTPDSIYISGDTVIGGNTYFVRRGTFYGNPSTGFVRDSSGYIVNEQGHCEFTLINPGTVLWTQTTPGIYEMEGALQNNTEVVSTPAGTFTCYDLRGTVTLYPPYDQWGSPRYTHHYYAFGIGKVKEVQFFVSSPSTIERRLVRYHVN